MKKSRILLIMTMFFAFSMSLVSCNDEPKANQIVGTWKCVDELAQSVYLNQFVQFTADGKYIEVFIIPPLVEGTDVTVLKLGGEWVLSGDKLVMKAGDKSVAVKVKSVSSTKMVFEILSVQIPYEKVDDSVMDKFM